MSKYYHIPNKGLINLCIEDFCEKYTENDLCFYTEAGSAALISMDYEDVEFLMLHYDE